MELSCGSVRGSSLELFTAARTITKRTGGQVITVVIGHDTDATVKNGVGIWAGLHHPRG